jgi:hypothetical protein
VVVSVALLRHTGTSSIAATATSAHHAASTTLPRSVATTTTTTTIPPPPAASIKLQVLNGVESTQPYALQFSKRLQTSPGYNTLAGDNATSKVLASTIYAVTPQYLSAAYALANTLGLSSSAVENGLPASAPVLAKERTIANLILVVGPDLISKP